ncbi:hypothetical protein UFOVP185_17 [uncultured Caudovirales phage]|uniref:Uncharacterized protein n=1 Tax=uncultured Caudovirales phage TaxID=2100421 RepID=A0A6J7WJA8_9CAUD|nr:hypothetical protein UFOVP185_17 [uncultured Caudovirales phage]
MKVWKLQRDTNKLIIHMIDLVNKHQGNDLNADDMMELFCKDKKELIDIFVETVKNAGNPQLDFLEIYY